MDQSCEGSRGRPGAEYKAFDWPRTPVPWGSDEPKVSSLPDSQGPWGWSFPASYLGQVIILRALLSLPSIV